jgi:hypothetical protein
VVVTLLRKQHFLDLLLVVGDARAHSWDEYVSNMWCKLALRILPAPPDDQNQQVDEADEAEELTEEQVDTLQTIVNRLQVEEHRQRFASCFLTGEK